MTAAGCECPPLRRFLIETDTWEEIDAHRGSCLVARWPQVGRLFEWGNIGPREKCTCVRASDVPEYVHDYPCHLNTAPMQAKKSIAAFGGAWMPRRCACLRVLVDGTDGYGLMVVHDVACKHFGRRT
jgi:hypothetical protein